MAVDDRAWCYYRNLVQTVYREIRHVGAPTDPEARLRIEDASFGSVIGNIRKWRAALKGTTLFAKIVNKTSTTAIRRPYEEVTGLRLEQVSALFARPGWDGSYGGEKWRRIAELTIELGSAIDAIEGERASALCDAVYAIEHNTGPLVPRRAEQHNAEKWPLLCDALEDSA
jgi:hypothetical protein